MYNNFKKRIRNFCKSILREEEKNIALHLQRMAGEETARYIQQHMYLVKAFSTRHEVLRYAISNIKNESGIIAEFGVFRGESLNLIASLLKENRRIYGFDCFEGLPQDWRTDFERGTFKVETLPKVPKNVELIKGLFNKTLPEFTKKYQADTYALIHIDCDLYTSTKDVLEILADKIQPGTILVFDEYFNYPGWKNGEFKAFNDFVTECQIKYEYIAYNQLHEQVAVKILENKYKVN